MDSRRSAWKRLRMLTTPLERLAVGLAGVAAAGLLAWRSSADAWGMLGNTLDTLLLGTLTAVWIDGLVVRTRAQQYRRVVDGMTDDLMVWRARCCDLLTAVMPKTKPEYPEVFNPYFMSDALLRHQLEWAMHGLSEAQLDVLATVGLPFDAAERMQPLADACDSFISSYSVARHAFTVRDGLVQANKKHSFLWYSGPPVSADDVTVATDSYRLAQADVLAARRRLSRELGSLVRSISAAIETLDPVGFRAVRRVPSPIRYSAYVFTALWSIVLLWSWSGRGWIGPPTFFEDNATNLIAGLATALVAAVVTGLASAQRRWEILRKTGPWYWNVISPIVLQCLSINHSEREGEEAAVSLLAEHADLIERAVLAIQMHNPNPALSYWTRVAAARMRALSTSGSQLFRTADDVVGSLEATLDLGSHPDLIDHHRAILDSSAKAARDFMSTWGAPPTQPYLDLLKALEHMSSAARIACCIKPRA